MLRKMLFGALVAVWSGPALASVDDVRDVQMRGYEYSYFSERVALDVETTMIAVFTDPERAQQVQSIEGFGVTPDMMQASHVPGWQYVRLPEAMQTRADIENMLRALERDRAFDFVSPVFLGTGGNPVVMTRDIFVAFERGADAATVDDVLFGRVPGTLLSRDFAGMPGVHLLRTNLRTAADVLDLVNDLASDPAVVFAQSDAIYWAERFGTYIPNDPMFSQQWALNHVNDHDMNAPEAWTITTGDPGIVTIVLDSGIDQNHNDINQIPGQTFTGSGTAGGPGGQCDNHGTAVAGCVAATIDNGIGLVGIAPTTIVRSGKIFNETFFWFFCTPFLESQDSWTVNGINWAANSGARVTNSSWGGGTASSVISTAFNNTRNQGVIHFAAAGNDGSSTISYPASLGTVNAVAATNISGAKASFSTFGPGLFISAPGENILTTDRMGTAGYSNGNTTVIDGTSFASPYAAGVAALVLSVNPDLSPSEVETILAATAKDRGTPGYNTTFGWGIVDAHAAALAALDTLPGTSCPADLDGSGTVDSADLLILLAAWGPCDCPEDLNGSGEVDSADLLELLSAWGPCS
jgi:subtilisin family serine protease